MAIDPNEVLTIEELSTYRKVSKSTPHKLAQEGILPAQKVGKHWRFHKGAIEEWLWRQAGHGQVKASEEQTK
jgi:excisionase family DNA binding protein